MKTRILILAANPLDTVRLRLDEEVREIRHSLRLSEHRDTFELRDERAVRREDVRRAMLNYRPSVVHFSGHGGGEEGIAFVNNQGAAEWVSTDALSGLFKLFADYVECVVGRIRYMGEGGIKV